MANVLAFKRRHFNRDTRQQRQGKLGSPSRPTRNYLPTPGPTSAPRDIVYLLGAGSTQAEIDFFGAKPLNLLMHDSDERGHGVATRILRLASASTRRLVDSESVDIEKLISLLGASAAGQHRKLADELRQLYFNDICQNLGKTKIATNPSLAMSLLQMHNIPDFKKHESLTAVVTTNHDGILQQAFQRVLSGVNLGFGFLSNDIRDSSPSESVPPLIQLHGSFTWHFSVPIRVSLLDPGTEHKTSSLWIPPAILKDAHSYPFNKLSGLTYDLLVRRCDVLRVVGSSLTQNDWNVVSLIFAAQSHRALIRKPPFRIELILPQKVGDNIKTNCSYLRDLFPIGYLTDGDFAAYKEDPTPTGDMLNPFAFWLRQKIAFHKARGDFGTSSFGEEMSLVAGGI